MATEQGIVIRVAENRAWVKTTKTPACEGCASRGSCGTAEDGRQMEVESINTVGAAVGDTVLIAFETASLMRVFFLVYLFPVLALLLGAMVGQQLAAGLMLDESLTALLTGSGFFLLAFFVVRFRGNRMARQENYRPRLVRIL